MATRIEGHITYGVKPVSDDFVRRMEEYKQEKIIMDDVESEFESTFDELSRRVHQTAKDKGWWDGERNDGELIALCHSELSEALEALRHGNPPDDKVPGFSGVEAELADVIIRIMDMAAARDWDVSGALLAKIAMNKTREHKHGGKRF